MLSALKSAARSVLKRSPIALSQNLRYDRQTEQIFRQTLRADSNAIDVGCHKGEMLDIILAAAPQGMHWGFEPIPALATALDFKYAAEPAVMICHYALGESTGETSFNYVVSNPAYSGFKRRTYDRASECDIRITVQQARLDDLIPAGTRVDLLKIDVEGGELGVLRGAQRLLAEQRPVVVFEFGLGAADHYGSTPGEVYEVLAKAGLALFTLTDYLKQRAPLTQEAFERQYHERINYYFVAAAAG